MIEPDMSYATSGCFKTQCGRLSSVNATRLFSSLRLAPFLQPAATFSKAPAPCNCVVLLHTLLIPWANPNVSNGTKT
jgi:hypothetical protein